MGDLQETHKTFKLPILPALPCEALQGKKITQEMIDSALAYDSKFRPSYLYLNDENAHGHGIKQNAETVGSILRTFVESVDGIPHVVAEVLPHRKYRKENAFEDLAAADGAYPGRSVDLWPAKHVPGCKTPFYLEGTALCGAQKPSIVNMPGIYYSTQTEQGILTFSVLTGEKNMPEEKKDEKGVDLAVQRQIDDLKIQLAKKDEDLKSKDERISLMAGQIDTMSGQLKTLGEESVSRKVESYMKDFGTRVKQDKRNEIKGTLENLIRNPQKITLATGEKDMLEIYAESILALPLPVKSFEVVSGGVGHQMTSGTEQPESRTAAIFQFATEAKLDPTTKPEDYDKAEEGARKKWPDLFRKEAR